MAMSTSVAPQEVVVGGVVVIVVVVAEHVSGRLRAEGVSSVIREH